MLYSEHQYVWRILILRIKFSYILFFLALAGGIGYAGWKIAYRPKPVRSVSIAAIRAENGIPITIYEAKRGNWEYWLPLYGTVRAPRLSQVSAARQDYLTDVRFDVGDVVKEGDLLAALDTKNLLEREAAARVRNKELEARYNRLTSVRQAGGSSSQETDTAFTQLRDSQATLKELTNEIGRSKITSPLAGVVVKRDAETGQLSSPSKPLFEIADMSLIEITLDVAPNVSTIIRSGLPAEVNSDKGWIAAVVRRINPLADQATGLYNCVLTVKNPEQGAFKLGSTVECRVLIEKEDAAIALPYEIVRESAGNSVVFVVSGDIVFERKVVRGRVTNQEVRILSGVSDSEMLVKKGVDRVYDGAKVWVQPEGDKK